VIFLIFLMLFEYGVGASVLQEFFLDLLIMMTFSLKISRSNSPASKHQKTLQNSSQIQKKIAKKSEKKENADISSG
jgi:hypothetical protein